MLDQLETQTGLLPYQDKAVEKLLHVKVGALYMEQGTGKTRTTIELIKHRFNRGKINRVLWLCPCSVNATRTIHNEFIKHCGYLPSWVIIKGIESLSQSDRLYMKLLYFVDPKVYLIVDESILVKNKRAIRTDRIIALSQKCDYKLILNGTPISRNEADLFAQWYILDWRILGYKSYWSFAANHLEFDEKISNRVCRVLDVDYLVRKIAPYTYQITKAEAKLNLPWKNYKRIDFWLNDEQMWDYFKTKDLYLNSVNEFKAETIYKLFTALQHVVSGRTVLTYPEQQMKTRNVFENPEDNPRVKALWRIIRNSPDKFIIFCKYTHEIESIAAILRSKGKTVVEFYGQTKRKVRLENVEKFRSDSQFFVANKNCSGYGLNLQFAHNIIYFSNDFDFATRAQSEDRVHRIGQTQEVNIYDLVAIGTIDEQIVRCLTKKESLAASFRYELKMKKDKTNLLNWLDGGVYTMDINYRMISSQKRKGVFYEKMGEFFASKAVRKEIGGYPLNNEDHYLWMVGESRQNSEIVGFICIEPSKKGLLMHDCYVRPEYREQKVFASLLHKVIEYATKEKQPLNASVNETLQLVFEKRDFEMIAKRGQWLTMRREYVEEIPK